jgi:hypothetical protein
VRAEALQHVWRLARESGDFPTIAQLSLPLLDELSPTREMAWFAGEATRALLLAEAIEQAQSWFAVARGEAPFDSEAALAEAQAWPLLRIALGSPPSPPIAPAETTLPATSLSRLARTSEPRRVRLTRESSFPWSDANLRRWIEAQQETDPEHATRRAALLVTIFDALGEPIDKTLWAHIGQGDVSDGPMPGAETLFALEQAAAAGRLGETVLLSLLALGEVSLRDVHPIVLNAVLGALNRVGLHDDSRRLALEAAIMAGL